MELNLEEFEQKQNEVQTANAKYLVGFQKWLSKNALSEKTIRTHVDNADFYINDFLCYYDAYDVQHGCYQIDSFLGDWFIRKAMWSSCSQIKSNAASIKKFYTYLLEKDIIELEDFDFLCKTIKAKMPDWQKKMMKYNEMLYEDDYDDDELYSFLDI